MINWAKIPCIIGFHNWYYGCFQTGKRSNFTGDHIGVSGRSCLTCPKKQIKYGKAYIDVKSFDHEDVKAHIL